MNGYNLFGKYTSTSKPSDLLMGQNRQVERRKKRKEKRGM